MSVHTTCATARGVKDIFTETPEHPPQTRECCWFDRTDKDLRTPGTQRVYSTDHPVLRNQPPRIGWDGRVSQAVVRHSETRL